MQSLIDIVFEDDVVALRYEIARGADINQIDGSGRTALIHAVLGQRLECAEALLAIGANPSIKDYAGKTALHYAAQDHLPTETTLLLRHGAPVDVEDVDGNTPLSDAVFSSRGRGEIVTALLKAGADRNWENKHGQTPLNLAKLIANYNVIQFFY